MIDIDFLNEIWYAIAEAKKISLESILKKTGVDHNKALKLIHILLTNEIVHFNEKEKTYKLKPYNANLYAKSILLNLNVLYLDQFVSLSKQEKEEASKIILSGVLNKKEQKEKQKNNNKKKLENLKNSNWLLILNDIKKVLAIYKEDEKKIEEYNILLSLKNEFDKNLKEYFKNN